MQRKESNQKARRIKNTKHIKAITKMLIVSQCYSEIHKIPCKVEMNS